jgi:chemosensory pili system protein ChpA (sensor histidine kinase/response regulator)
MTDDSRVAVSVGDVSVDGPLRVLIADDDRAVRALLVTVLARRGYVIDTVQNGAEAMQKIAASDYFAILLDLMMPVADGYEVIAYLEKTAPKVLSSKVIVLTAVSNAELRRLEGKSIFRILRKPFDLTDLANAVADCAPHADLSRLPARIAC